MLPRCAANPRESTCAPRWAVRVGSFLFWTVVFGVAYTQAPLYYSNQNQYFLHGLAQGGVGLLDQDWLANTHDPTPLFSGMVAVVSRHLHPAVFHVCYLLLLGLYFHSLVGIFSILTGRRPGSSLRLVFIVLFTLLHCALLRLASTRLLGVDYPWLLQSGVATQYILGPGLQPSTFGVLLLFSLVAFLRGRLFVAVTCSALAAVLHATYLLGAAWFTLAYLILCWRDGRVRGALLLGAWALLLVLPGVIHHLLTFGPTTGEQFAQAQRILVDFRIPHHAIPARWLDRVAVGQMAWVGVALALTRGSRLFPILLLVAGASVVMTLLQIASHSPSLALLFPWRTSVILVPVATTVILARSLQLLAPWIERWSFGRERALHLACGLALVVVVTGGVVVNSTGMVYRSNPQEVSLLDHVRTHKAAGDVYLLPVEVPEMAAGPRSASTVRPAAPIDFQRFRLQTGVPIVVDFKAIPYKDVEVLEWLDRLHMAQWLYAQTDWDLPEVQSTLERYGVTHVVATSDQLPSSERLETLYSDDHYRIYRVHRPPQAARSVSPRR